MRSSASMEEEKLLLDGELAESNKEEGNMPARATGPSRQQSVGRSHYRAWKILWPWVAHCVLLMVSFGALSRSMIIKNSLPANCLEARRQWSIVMNPVPERIHFERSRGSFNRSSSRFKGPPSPAVDLAWDEITDYGALSISEDVYEKLNASKNAVKIPLKYGGGRQAYFEVFHQLHCLRNLWQHTYPDYYTEVGESIKQNDEEWHNHMDHCTEMLRQKLVCDVDVQVLTYNWIKGHEAPHPNFNTPRQCRSFEDVQSYALNMTMDGSKIPGGRLAKPKNGSVREYDEPPFDPLDDGLPSQ